MPIDSRLRAGIDYTTNERSSEASFTITQDISGKAYFKVPYTTGNNMKSYGGYLTYRVSFIGQLTEYSPTVIVIVSTFHLIGHGNRDHATSSKRWRSERFN